MIVTIAYFPATLIVLFTTYRCHSFAAGAACLGGLLVPLHLRGAAVLLASEPWLRRRANRPATLPTLTATARARDGRLCGAVCAAPAGAAVVGGSGEGSSSQVRLRGWQRGGGKELDRSSLLAPPRSFLHSSQPVQPAASHTTTRCYEGGGGGGSLLRIRPGTLHCQPPFPRLQPCPTPQAGPRSYQQPYAGAGLDREVHGTANPRRQGGATTTGRGRKKRKRTMRGP